ncbi:MAG: hypothetical protein V3T14_09735 [Myxococcota bacterium]
MLRWSFVLLSFLLVFAGSPPPAGPFFHFAHIDELMTSYADNPDIQFVEIEMEGLSQNRVQNSVLAAFDSNGVYLADVLVVPSDVPFSGGGVSWIMGTQAFADLSGVSVDFLFPPGLPTVGGMVCWGSPGILPPPPGTWVHTNPANYVDCVAYGTYTGPCNVFVCGALGTGRASPLDADGRSLVRVADTNDNANDFACGDPASPRNNRSAAASLLATHPCPGGDADSDGVDNAIDSCPFEPNGGPESQADSDQDGRGDVCECGNVDGNTAVDIFDALRIAQGTLQPPLVEISQPRNCDVDHNGVCDIFDALRVAQATLTPPLVDIVQLCPAATVPPS